MPELKFGSAATSAVNTDADNFDIDTRFRMIKEAGVFDYVEKTPLPGELETYQRASEKYDLPIRAGGFYYTKGRDEPLLEWHLRQARELGSFVQNIQIKTRGVDGKAVTDDEVAELYLWAAERGEQLGVTPCFEVHVNMWSEHLGRVERVGDLVERRGVPFNITLDHSHVIFKIDNPREQAVQDMKADIDAGRLELDPFKPGNVTDLWISRNWVRHAHARAAIPANPVNVWAKHPDGSFGRGIQYPFIQPEPGEWHSDWDKAKLEPWKKVLRHLLRHHARSPESRLGQVTTEFIPGIDYGAGAKYSIFQQGVACASWLRETWVQALADAANGEERKSNAAA